MAVDYAAEYDSYWRDPRHAQAQGYVDADTLAENILLSCAGGNVLDLGAGMGGLVRALLRLGVDAHGVDVAALAVERANVGAPQRFHLGSLLDLPFADGSYDTMVATNVLECLDPADLAQALAQLRRVVRRTVFLRIATGAAADGAWHRTVQSRTWWEQQFLAAGFRKHPAYYALNEYTALEHDGDYLTLVFERLPDSVALDSPWHAVTGTAGQVRDMLRHSGARADASLARYRWAAQYVRPGDMVLDAACGLGDGSYLLQSGSVAGNTVGIAASAGAMAYAQANFAATQGGLAYRCGTLATVLAEMPAHTVDVVLAFDILATSAADSGTLAAIRRVLTPGGRLIVSVPNGWSDGDGALPAPGDPLARLCRDLETEFILEALAAQTADQAQLGADTATRHAAARMLQRVPLATRSDGMVLPAQWWLAVAMRSPLDGATVPYRESAYPTYATPRWNVTTYERDYQNPWLVRSMVDTGHRLDDAGALATLAEHVAETAPADSPDVGAALCVLAYQLMGAPESRALQIAALDERVERYFSAGPKTPHGVRWSVSLLFVLGKLWLGHGEQTRARSALQRCAAIDALSFSALLCNRSVEAHLLLGELDIADGDALAAAAQWRAGIAIAQRAVSADWQGALGSLDQPAEFGLPELASMLEYASACAFALAHVGEIGRKYWWWLHPRRDRLSQSRQAAKQLQHTRLAVQSLQEELQRYQLQAGEFTRQALQREEVAQVHAQRAATELAAYGEQAVLYAQQVGALQASALAQQQALLVCSAEMQAAQDQAQACGIRLAAQDLTLKAGAVRLAEQESMLQASAVRLAEQESMLQVSAVRLAEQESMLQVSAVRLAEQESLLGAMRESNSWRLTRPLRGLFQLMKRKR